MEVGERGKLKKNNNKTEGGNNGSRKEKKEEMRGIQRKGRKRKNK